MSLVILEAKTASVLLRKGYQVLSVPKEDSVEVESQGQEATMFGGITRIKKRGHQGIYMS